VQVVPALLHALTDPEGDVRGAAAFALGQFSEYLQPDITSHHKEVLPGVFRLLQDPSMDVQERACYGESTGTRVYARELVATNQELRHVGAALQPWRWSASTITMSFVCIVFW
jgi:hypothetical protein